MIRSLPPSATTTWPFLPPSLILSAFSVPTKVAFFPAHFGAFRLPASPGADVADGVTATDASRTPASVMAVATRTAGILCQQPREHPACRSSPPFRQYWPMELGFNEVLLFSGVLLAIAAALSGLFHGTVLSVSVLGVTVGAALAGADLVDVSATDDSVVQLIELALIVTLFSDGLFVQRELLVVHWSAPVRALALAMPLTLLFLAVAAKGLFGDLTWAEAFLLAAVLSPTDPVVTSTVVTSQRVPESIRHTLNLESGLNDGLALPFVLFFIVLASPGGDAGKEAIDLLGEAAVGAIIGVALGLLAGRLTHHLPAGGMERRYEGIFALGIGLIAFGIAEVTIGNGFIAAFVCGIALAVADHDIADDFVDFSENVSSILQVLAFFVFGALIVTIGLSSASGCCSSSSSSRSSSRARWRSRSRSCA